MYIQAVNHLKAQVKYLLIAQLVMADDGTGKYMIGKIPELGMSNVRHELSIYVNNHEATPSYGMRKDMNL